MRTIWKAFATLPARYRAWRRSRQAWAHGQRVSLIEAIEDVQKY